MTIQIKSGLLKKKSLEITVYQKTPNIRCPQEFRNEILL